ncbi:MAG: hypothetical protein O9272_14695, partial [Brevundimonas sp.]|nr:hypothetical protein [Brevundimonas sp.]
MPAAVKKPIRKFTDQGLKLFEAYVATGPVATKPPPVELLFDDNLATPLGYGEVTVKPFKQKFDMGMSVLTDLGRDNVTALLHQTAVWSWLSLLFHESTIQKKGHGWFVGSRLRHILDKPSENDDEGAADVQDPSKYSSIKPFRHLVYGAVFNVATFGSAARVLMEAPHEQSKIEENIMSRRVDFPLAGSEEVVKAVHRLYWDP